MQIDNYAPSSGRILNERGQVVNLADLLSSASFVDNFASMNPDNWEIVQEDAAHTVQVMGTSVTHLSLTTLGTAVGRNTYLSKQRFRLPISITAMVSSTTAGTANAYFALDLVAVDSDGNILPDANTTNKYSAGAANAAGFVFEGITTGSAIYYIRPNGAPEYESAAVSFGTNANVSTGTAPNFLSTMAFTLDCDLTDMVFSAVAINSLTAAPATFRRNLQTLDGNCEYRIRMQLVTTGIGAAKTFRINSIQAKGTSKLNAAIRVYGRQADISGALPVTISGTPTVNFPTTPTVNTRANDLWYLDTTANLAASTIFTSTARTTGTSAISYYRKMLLYIDCDQPLEIVHSISNTTTGTDYREVETKSTVAGTAGKFVVLTFDNGMGYYQKFSVENKGTATTTRMKIMSLFTN